MSQAYQESYPFWSAPPSPEFNKLEHFKIGSRVINIDSQRFEWIPFGLRGTVVGKAENTLIVLFDE